ncbi:MAG: DNA repair protein RecO [Cytophagaceae bacterium]
MIYKTRGIVLNFIRYRETSIITKIYTDLFGMQTYIVNGVRSKKSKNKIALFQPLTLLDMVVYYNEKKDINRLSEIRCEKPFNTIPLDQKKIAIAIFLTEIIYKTMKEESSNNELFEFIHLSISYLDEAEDHFVNFHLQFLLKYAGFLGFAPTESEDSFINLNTEEKTQITQLLTSPYGNDITISNKQRRVLLESIIRFYSVHIENFNKLNSIKVLQEII